MQKHLLLFSFLTLSIPVLAQKTFDVSSFPITAINQTGAKRMVLYLSGDGGMNGFSKDLIQALGEKNYALVSLDSRKYFWEQKTPERMAQELSLILSHYLKIWSKDEFSIVGYSFGADAALLLSTQLSKDLLPKYKSMVLLSPSSSTDLVVHVSDLIGFGTREGKYKTAVALEKTPVPVLCIFGIEEDSEFYKNLKEKKNLEKVRIPGSHKFNNDIKKVTSTILSGL